MTVKFKGVSRLKRLALGITLALMLLVSFSALASAQNIGYVDFELLFYSHPEYEAKNKELQESAEQMWSQAQAELEKLSEQEAIDQLVAHYESQFAEVEDRARVELVAFILEIIGKVAENHGIEIVLPESAIIYGGVNLTVPVVEAMYSSYGISVPSSIRELIQTRE